MVGLSPLSLALALVAASAVSLLVLWVLGRIASGASGPRAAAPPLHSASFLFRDNALIDQDTRPDTLPGLVSGDIRTWSDLRHWLGNRFGPLPDSLDDIAEGDVQDLPATGAGDPASLALSRLNGTGRVEVLDPAPTGPLERHRARRLDTTVTRYQAVFDHAPCGVRILDPSGRMIWQNAIFAARDPGEAQALVDAVTRTGDSQARVSLPCDPPEAGRVFQVAHVRAGDVRAVFATDVTEVAAAETMRREFIQTLTKIFANLTTGLAVFDRHRRLVLFNPALIDLVGLSAPFLSAQPSLFRFFDSLRDARVLPEPRNYGTWRKQIEDVIETASGGLYLEDWHQPCGTTFRVTGRPHPDGAIAFLFEDITDNVSLARHFRSQVALRDAILDSSDVARVVFGPDNVVTFCNRACRDMLGIDPDATFAEMTLDDVLKACGNVLPRGDI